MGIGLVIDPVKSTLALFFQTFSKQLLSIGKQAFQPISSAERPTGYTQAERITHPKMNRPLIPWLNPAKNLR